MDNRRPPNSSRAPSSNPPSGMMAGSSNIGQPQTQNANPLGQLSGSAAANQSYDDQHTYPSMAFHPNFYTNFMPAQIPPLSLPWNLLPTLQPSHPHQAAPSHYPQSFSMNTSTLPFIDPIGSTDANADAARTGTRWQQQPSSQTSTVGSSTAAGSPVIPPDVEQAIVEGKKHRNTAASARFRIKKKHKIVALERTVCDLKSRSDELEREVADLRQENGWLREIVMLKGTQYAANNPINKEAPRKAAMASSQVMGAASVKGLGTQDRHTDEAEEESDKEDTESDDDPVEHQG